MSSQSPFNRPRIIAVFAFHVAAGFIGVVLITVSVFCFEAASGARQRTRTFSSEAAAVGSDFALGRTPLAPRVGLAPQAVAADSGAGAAARTLPEIRERLLAGEYEGEGAYDQRAIATDLKGPGTVVVGNFQNADLQRFLVHTIQNWKPLRKHWELHYYNRLKQRKQAAAAQGQSSRDMQSDIPPVFDGPYPFQPCDGTESMSSPAWTGAAQNRTGGEHPRWVTVFQEVLMGLDEPADANAPPPSPWAYNPAPVTGSWDDEASAVQRLCSLYLNSWTSERGSQHSSVDEFQENVGGSLKNEQPSPHMAGGATQDSTNKSNWCTQASNSMLVLGLMRQGLRFSKVAIDPYLAQRHELVPGATSVQMGSKTVPFFNQITSAMTYFTYAAAPGVWFPGGCPVPYWTDSAPFLQFQRAHVNELDTEGAAENWINTHKGQLEADHKADHPGDSGLQPGDIIMVVSRGGAPTGHTVTVAHREPEGKAWDEPGQNVSVLSGNSVGLEGLTSAKKWSDTGYARTDGVVRSERYLTAKDGGYSYQRACSLAPAYQNAYAAFRADIKARENREPTYNEINQFRQKFESDNQVKLNPDIPSGTVQVVSVTRSSQLNAHELVNDAAKQKQLGLAAFDLLASFGRSKEEEQLLAQVFHGVPGKKKT